MSDNATSKDIVDLAMNDKPNAAGEAMNDILLNKVGEKVSAMKDQISVSYTHLTLPTIYSV